MKILVIGNGFDIAHGLPTSYPEFLNFVKEYRKDESASGAESSVRPDAVGFIARIKSAENGALSELKELLSKENKLLDFFLAVYEDRCKVGKRGWVDFEAEISDVIKAFDKIYEIEKEEELRGNPTYIVDTYLQNAVGFLFLSNGILTNNRIKSYCNSGFPIGFFEPFVKDLFEYLNELTRIFEIYLIEYVEKIETKKRIPQIYELKDQFDCLVTFNYTDTFRRLYRKDGELRCCFIHGKTKADSSLEDCSLVLGIDEYLPEDRQDRDNRFAWFKKFYQRIYKETSSVYIDWLEEDLEENSKRGIPLYIYFYGHSLDVTDKDVLNKLIMYENAEIRIFYHNKKALSGQINNLIKIIGEKNLIHMTRGSQRKIHFIQSDRVMDQQEIEDVIRAGQHFMHGLDYNHE